MFGVKINEFDNSDGTIKTFNKIFIRTILGKSLGAYVEIDSIVDNEGEFGGNPFVRYLKFYDKNWNFLRKTPHDFGESNFYNNEDFIANERIRFKYIAKDLYGDTITKAYSIKDLAEKMNVGIQIIRSKLLNKTINKKYPFTIIVVEI